jgi:hypothetical protein
MRRTLVAVAVLLLGLAAALALIAVTAPSVPTGEEAENALERQQARDILARWAADQTLSALQDESHSQALNCLEPGQGRIAHVGRSLSRAPGSRRSPSPRSTAR